MSKVSYGTITLTDTIDTDLLGGHFIYNSDGAGVIQNIGSGPSEWGYNTWIGANGIQLRDAATPYATLDRNGLTLSKGGIKANIGDPNKNRVYLSSEDYGNLTINDHTASNWREVIGSKFGVDAEGNVYASNVNIQGTIEALEGSTFGNKEGMHISISAEEIAFWSGKEEEAGQVIETNKTAYITGQYMYIPYTVVLNEMRVGTKSNYKEIENPSGNNPSEQRWYEIINGEYVQTTDTTIVSGKIYYEKKDDIPLWSWKKMSNHNLRLIWLGGEE